MKLAVKGIPSDLARNFWAGGPDAQGQTPLRRFAEGPANPCRHCLQLITEGDEKLVLSYRPFALVQPYAEIGPIFLHSSECIRYEAEQLPTWFRAMTPAMIRGYDKNDWIRYETGDVVAGSDLTAACEMILSNPGVVYVHIRSKFGCFQCRVDRA